MKTAFAWLNLSSEGYKVLISSGHCETASLIEKNENRYGRPLLELEKRLKKWEYTVRDIAAAIDETKLRKGNILVIGNAWGNFTQSEIDAVEDFVKNGGSLFVGGLGWSWGKYIPEYDVCKLEKKVGQKIQDISTYPMNRLVEPYKMQWTASYINRTSRESLR